MATKFEISKTKEVDVFKTNVMHETDAEEIVRLLSNYFPNHNINFDLDDCDKILRLEGLESNRVFVKNALLQYGFMAEILV